MGSSKIIVQVISFFAYILLQSMILQNVVLFDSAFCFLYVAIILLLPVDMGVLALMFFGFITGFTVDIFYNSMGIHASACVFIMFVRNYWLNLITPQGGYDSGAMPSIELNGGQWFFGYAFPLVFIHHLILFFVEAFGFGLFGFTLWKAVLSTVFTMVVVLVFQFIFYKKRRS